MDGQGLNEGLHVFVAVEYMPFQNQLKAEAAWNRCTKTLFLDEEIELKTRLRAWTALVRAILTYGLTPDLKTTCAACGST